jgi:hypothetical protein
MKHHAICQWLVAITLTFSGLAPSSAAELERRVVHRHVHYRHAIVLPPERHVVEIVKNAYSDRFIINGARFSAKTPACGLGWLAGERVKFLSGEIHGACVDALIYNATRRQTCEMWCGGSIFW